MSCFAPIRILNVSVCLALCLVPAMISRSALAQPANGSDDKVLNLTFDDLTFEMEKNETFSRDMLTDEIVALRGKRISLPGFILPSTQLSGITAFVFVRDNQECCFGPGAALFDCVLVKLKKDHAVDFTTRAVTVEGDFMIKEYKVGKRVMAVFRMKNCTVSQ